MKYWLFVICSLLSTSVYADWKLNKASSSMSFVSIKNNEIGEVSRFKSFDASIDKQGKFSMIVNLDSVDTRYLIRDKRLRMLLFETNKHSVANITGRMPVKALASMTAGDTKRFTVTVKVNLHGYQETLKVDLRLLKKRGQGFIAVTESPVLIHAQAFNLTEGIKRLIESVELETITWVVPVTFALSFR